MTPAEKPAGGAPILDLLVVGAGTSLLTLGLLLVLRSYRRGGAPRLRTLLAATERLVGVPGWAALPGLGAIGCAIVTIWGATWDIGLHIDLGRDEGPLGTAAHYPLLLGLFGSFLMGVMAAGLAPQDPARSSAAAFRVPGLGAVPAAAVLLTAASGFAMLGFPLDDLWHRLFGQDVTLWGPTHTMFIGGVLAAGAGASLLVVEGARAAGRDALRGGATALRRPMPAVLASIFLYFWAATTHEFNWGVPQYAATWQPMMLAFGAAHAFVLARMLAGRGGALLALAIWLPMQVAMTLAIGGPLETTMPALPLFVAEALLVEALALRGTRRSPLAFGLTAGALVGTLGFAAEAAWSQLVMPLPWERPLLEDVAPLAAVAGVAGGALGALMALALQGRLDAVRRPALVAAAAVAVALGLGFDASRTDSPEGVTATLALSDERVEAVLGGWRTEVADLTVRLSRPELAQERRWLVALGWQGGGRFLTRLERAADGTFRSVDPVPVGGTWKLFVRLHADRTMLSVPVRMPADPAIDFAGFPARDQVTRAMVPDTDLLQVERREDAPMWAWTPAFLLVLAADLALLALLGAICVRLGRRREAAPIPDAPPPGLLLVRAEQVLDVVERRRGREREPAGVA